MTSIRAVGFYLTYKCSAKCAHCYLSCGPDRTEEMPVDDAMNWIDQIGQMPQVSWISLIGGEPLLYDGLGEVVARIRKYDKMIKLYTNCSWAADIATAIQVLGDIKPRMLATSHDAFHRKFVPLERVKNAIRACRTLKIPAVASLGVHDYSSTAPELASELAEFGDFLKTYESPWIEPIGRGAEVPPTMDIQGVENNFNTSCRPGIVTVRVDGSVVLCCRAFPVGNESSVFSVGNLYKSSLVSILENADPLLSIPQNHSLHEMVDVVKRAGLCNRLKRDRPYKSNCDLCDHMLKDEAIRAALEILRATC